MRRRAFPAARIEPRTGWCFEQQESRGAFRRGAPFLGRFSGTSSGPPKTPQYLPKGSAAGPGTTGFVAQRPRSVSTRQTTSLQGKHSYTAPGSEDSPAPRGQEAQLLPVTA